MNLRTNSEPSSSKSIPNVFPQGPLSDTTQNFANQADSLFTSLRSLIDNQNNRTNQLEATIHNLLKQVDDLNSKNILLNLKNQQLEDDNKELSKSVLQSCEFEEQQQNIQQPQNIHQNLPQKNKQAAVQQSNTNDQFNSTNVNNSLPNSTNINNVLSNKPQSANPLPQGLNFVSQFPNQVASKPAVTMQQPNHNLQNQQKTLIKQTISIVADKLQSGNKKAKANLNYQPQQQKPLMQNGLPNSPMFSSMPSQPDFILPPQIVNPPTQFSQLRQKLIQKRKNNFVPPHILNHQVNSDQLKKKLVQKKVNGQHNNDEKQNNQTNGSNSSLNGNTTNKNQPPSNDIIMFSDMENNTESINISSDEDLALDLQMPKRNNKDSKEVDNNLVQNNKNGDVNKNLDVNLMNVCDMKKIGDIFHLSFPPVERIESEDINFERSQAIVKKKFECHICHRKYSSRAGLRTHMNVHDENKAYKCRVCFKNFQSKATLDEHYRIHSGEKPFQCRICGKRFSQRPNMRAHELTHSIHKQFKCSLCSKLFCNKKQLQRHMVFHGERKHECTLCGKKFHTTTNLRLHQQRTHFSLD